MAHRPRLRIPALEMLAALHGGAFTGAARELTASERELLTGVFGDSLHLDSIRIAEAPVANSPTTLGNTIRVRKGASLPDSVLVHEAMHVWQFQTQGTAYVSDSALHQGVALLRTGSRDAAYEVQLIPGASILDYTAEQQAMIVENAFLFDEWRSHPDVARLMTEVRAARPKPFETILEEASGSETGMHPLFRIDW